MSTGLLSLKWNNHHSTFLNVLSTLRDKESSCDATIVCGGTFYPVHKFILSACSEYFEKIFDSAPCRHPFIIFKDVQEQELQALLSYMYEGEVNVYQENLSKLVEAAELLKVKGFTFPNNVMPKGFESYLWNAGGSEGIKLPSGETNSTPLGSDGRKRKMSFDGEKGEPGEVISQMKKRFSTSNSSTHHKDGCANDIDANHLEDGPNVPEILIDLENETLNLIQDEEDVEAEANKELYSLLKSDDRLNNSEGSEFFNSQHKSKHSVDSIAGPSGLLEKSGLPWADGSIISQAEILQNSTHMLEPLDSSVWLPKTSGSGSCQQPLVNLDVSEILKQDVKGQLVFDTYSSLGTLTEKARRALVNIVIEYFMKRTDRLTNAHFKQIAYAIIDVFKSENLETYYVPPSQGKKMSKGKLVDKYRNNRRRIFKINRPAVSQ